MKSWAPLLLGLGVCVAAQGARISGVVVAAQGGEPLASVELSLSRVEAGETGGSRRGRGRGSRSSAGARSGLDGRFAFQDVEPGEYIVGAHRTGFEGGGRTATQVILEESDSTASVQIRLNRSPAIEGRAVDADGDPLAGATVELRAWTMAEGRRVLRSYRNTRTDDRGEYRVYNLSPGRYLAYLHPTTLGAAQGGVLHETAGVYYPQGAKPSEAARIELRWGIELEGLDFVAPQAGNTLISGVVHQADGAACPSCSVAIVGEAGPPVAATRLSRAGRFAVHGLAPGDYTLVAGAPRGGASAVETLYLPERRPLEMTLALQPGRAVSGALTAKELQGPDPPAFDRTGVRLLPSDAAIPGRPIGARVRGDGSFEISDAPQGVYNVLAYSVPAPGYLRRVLLGGTALPDGRIRVSEGPVHGLELEIAFDGGSVRGRAVSEDGDSPAPPDGMVVLVPLDASTPSAGHRLDGYRDSDVSFQFRGVPPGEYLVFATPRNFSWDWSDPALMAELRRRATRVEVEAHSAAEADAPYLTGP